MNASRNCGERMPASRAAVPQTHWLVTDDPREVEIRSRKPVDQFIHGAGIFWILPDSGVNPFFRSASICLRYIIFLDRHTIG